METEKIDRRYLVRAIVFVVIVVVGAGAWLVIDKVLMPPAVVTRDNSTALARNLNPRLDTSSVAVMTASRSISSDELAKFNIYIHDDEVGDESDGLRVRLLTPSTPYDLAYIAISDQS